MDHQQSFGVEIPRHVRIAMRESAGVTNTKTGSGKSSISSRRQENENNISRKSKQNDNDMIVRKHSDPRRIQRKLKPRSAHKADRLGLKGSSKNSGKKNGMGKFNWGLPGDELEDDPTITFGEKDPESDHETNNDDHVLKSARDVKSGYLQSPDIGPLDATELDSRFSLSSSPSSSKRKTKSEKCEISLPAFKTRMKDALDEFFISEDFSEFVVALENTESPAWYYEAVRRAITIAMERKERECELTSQLLSFLCLHGVLDSKDVGKGFLRLFEVVDDLVLDIPHAKELISRFLARAVADEVLPPIFLVNPQVTSMGGEIVEHAKVLLSTKHGVVRMERVWGSGDLDPVPELKRKIKALLYEYLSSSDLDEVDLCVKQLHVPHFHHELVKRAVIIAMDHGEREQGMISTLFAELYIRGTLSTQQLEAGFRRLVGTLPDLRLDIPKAEEILKVFVSQAYTDGCIRESFAKSLF